MELRKEGEALPGVAGSELSKDQLELLQKVVTDILAPYRKEDVDEVMDIVKKNGGVWLHNDVVLRLQVDDNPEPIMELRRLIEKAVRQFGLGAAR